MMYLYTEKKNRIDVSEKSALLYLNSNGNVFFCFVYSVFKTLSTNFKNVAHVLIIHVLIFHV